MDTILQYICTPSSVFQKKPANFTSEYHSPAFTQLYLQLMVVKSQVLLQITIASDPLVITGTRARSIDFDGTTSRANRTAEPEE